jgi:hypothetical protein
MSTICAVVALWVLHRLSHLLNLGNRTISLAVLAALSPQVIWASSAVRGYSLTILLTACATHYFARLWVVGTERTVRDCALYLLFCYLAILNFYYAAFVVAAFFLAAVIVQGSRRLILAVHAALAMLLLPLVPTILTQLSRHPIYDWPIHMEAGRGLAAVVGLARWVFETLFYAFFVDAPHLLRRPGILPAVVIIVAATLAALVWERSRRWSRAEVAFAVTAFAPCLLMLALIMFHISLVEQRHWAIIVVNVLVSLTLLISRISAVQARRTVGLLYTIFFAVAAGSYQLLHSVDFWPQTASYIAANEQRGEPIVFYSAFGALPFQHEYHGPNPLRGIPVDAPWESPVAAQKYRTDRRDVREAYFRDALWEAVGANRSFWLVSWSVGGADHDVRRLLEAYAKRRLVLLDSRTFGAVTGEEFKGVRVYRFQVPASAIRERSAELLAAH